MNIDDLKDAWNHDEPKGMQLALSTAALGKTNSAVGRIRKNMKAEFIAVMISYFILTLFTVMHFIYDASSLIRSVLTILLFTIVTMSCFYYLRFYVFYKSIRRYDLSVKNSIQKFTYELELNTEIYKTYNFCLTPLALMVGLAVYGGKTTVVLLERLFTSDGFRSPIGLLLSFLTILISFSITYICVNYHVRMQYGQYVAELKRVMDDLGNEG
jgi:hypothetical protein